MGHEGTEVGAIIGREIGTNNNGGARYHGIHAEAALALECVKKPGGGYRVRFVEACA